MGHFYEEIVGVGKNRQEAEERAIADFLHEEGHRHTVYGVSKHELIEEVPPTKPKITKVPGRYDYGSWTRGYEIMSFEPDPTAPKSEWLQKWRMELHTHA